MRKVKLPGASIYKDSNGTTHCWRVRLGKRFTGGAPSKKSFDTYRAASKWLRQQVQSRDAHGRAAFALSDAQLAEAQDAFKRLHEGSARCGRGLSLSSAVTFFLRHGAPKGGKRPVAEVCAEWLREKLVQTTLGTNSKSSPTLHGVKSIIDRFALTFGTRPINEVSTKDCQKFLDGLKVSPNSRRHYARDLSTVFQWAIRPPREWIHENPWLNVLVPKKTPISIGILSPDEAERLLIAAAAEPQMPLLGSLVLGLFAGLRTAERNRLDWSAVHMVGSSRYVEVKAAWAKTGARRTVPLSDAAIEWLLQCPTREGRLNPANSEWRYAELCRRAGVRSPRNALRHSYASYRYALVRDAAAVAADLGHDSLRTLKRHYVDVVAPELAQKFFSLRPAIQPPQAVPASETE